MKNPKQSRASSRRNVFMPLTALFAGLAAVPWRGTFRAVREASGLQCSSALDHSLIPGVSASGAWLQEWLSSSQFQVGLGRSGGLMQCPNADLALISKLRSHSCKATLISWGSKAGLSDKTLTFRGYHSHGVKMASVGYRRDALVGPLREPGMVVLSMQAGQSLPDVARSGRWQEPASSVTSAPVVSSPPSSNEKKAGNCEVAVNAETSSSSDSSTVFQASDDGDEQLVASAPHFVENLLVVGGLTVAENKRSGLLHVLRQDAVRLLCGRSLRAGFTVSSHMDAGSKKFSRTCKTCVLPAS